MKPELPLRLLQRLQLLTQSELRQRTAATTINLGSSVTVTCASTGGTGTKQYAVFYKQKSQSTWTKVRDYATGTSVKVTPKASTTYTIRVKAKDGSGDIKNKDFTITVKA